MGRQTFLAMLAAVCLLGAGCQADADEGRPTAVAAVYPLAYAAERIAGPGWQVVDLTPPGEEAHDVDLSLDDRETISRADLLLLLDPGLQPQLWDAIGDTGAVVRAVSDRPLADPHVWLSPGSYLREIAELVRHAFVQHQAAGGDRGYVRRFDALRDDLRDLARAYFRTIGGDRCRHDTMIVSHEAFGWLARDYGLRQFGLAGLTPEAEPTSDRLLQALRLIESGEAGAVFHETTEDAERVARALAGDAGVPALPLSTLESRPSDGDYLSVMHENLESLREGLGCR
ncbi:MAG TPA: metal ABC transporter substrate-binding protein [Actinomycetota bacterium]|nr:metal ABC transporter substrate-binding protein [Actinomycetota bacterium]